MTKEDLEARIDEIRITNRKLVEVRESLTKMINDNIERRDNLQNQLLDLLQK